MKLAELKNHFKNRYAIRIVAGILTVALVGGSVSAYTVLADKTESVDTTEAAEISVTDETETDGESESKLLDMDLGIEVSDEAVGKEESVFILADASGNTQKTIVSNHLYNREHAATITDESTLTDIENVKGEETFTRENNSLTWQADGKEIYYQGTTTEKAPVEVQVTYFLDGKEISPKELAGKSGRVTIRYDYTNNSSYTGTVDGTEYEVKVPFVALSALVFDDNFSNIEVTNGKIIENENANIVVGYALPGMKDSLKLDEKDLEKEKEIPEYFEVSADVTDFSLDIAMTVVENAGDMVSSDGMDLSELDTTIQELSDASRQLVDGSAELAEGVDTLKAALPDFVDGIGTLQKGIKAYTNGVEQVDTGLDTLKTGIKDYTDGVKQVDDGLNTLNGKLGGLTGGMSTLMDGVKTLNASAASVSNGVSALDTALNTAMTDEEKKATAEAAAKQAVAAVDAQLADDTNERSYNNIKAQAGNQVKAALTADSTVSAMVTQLSANDSLTAAIALGLQEQIIGSLKANTALTSALTYAGTDVEGFLYSIETSAGTDRAGAVKYIYENGIVVGGVTYVSAGEIQGAIAVQLGLPAAPAEYTSLKNAVVNAQLTTMAQSILGGVATMASDQLGTSVADAVKQASDTVASQVASTVAVSAAETTKKTIATQIEAVGDTGYSLVTGVTALAQGTQKLADSMPELSTGVSALTAGVQQLVSGADTLVANNGTLNSGTKQLKAGTTELVANNKDLNSGAKQLAAGTADISDGVDALSSGAHELADGMFQFNEEGIEEIVNAYTGDVKPLVNRLQTVLDAGASYRSYTGIAEGVKGSVKFIYKMEAISSDNE